MSDAALKKEMANVNVLEAELLKLRIAEPIPQVGEKFVKEVMERDEPLTPKKDQVKEENPWTEGDGGGCTIV